MTGNEIREKFLEYFERHGHTRVRSSPLLPANDPTLLFTNAGMNQFKDVFLGVEKRDYVRACSSQKCLRAGGKHNDLDEVGKTARHQTFFEMLGNFSFGDYFKEDAIKFAWDFLVNELKMDSRRLWFTVFGGDDEVGPDEDAEQFWAQVGASREKILRFGRKDNFWQMADTGPCGPCSEIHYYLGDDPDDPTKNRVDLVNGPGDTTMEIWNLVFMQYNRVEVEPGKYDLEPLPKPSVDTGLGLERTAVIMQGVKSNYDTDLFVKIIKYISGSEIAGKPYVPDTQEGFAMRVVADHARATAFSIADGIIPGNEGRNYVLRKIMQRAIYHLHYVLYVPLDDDPENSVFFKVTNKVVDLMREPYPELETQRGLIERVVKLEHQRFVATQTKGLVEFERWRASFQSPSFFEKREVPKTIDFKKIAWFYDTLGLQPDLMRVRLEEEGLAIEEGEFNSSFSAAVQELQQSATKEKIESKAKAKAVFTNIANRINSLFRGYETTRVDDAKVLAVVHGDAEVSELTEGDDGEVILDQTPFYAESGGQVGDVGRMW